MSLLLSCSSTSTWNQSKPILCSSNTETNSFLFLVAPTSLPLTAISTRIITTTTTLVTHSHLLSNPIVSHRFYARNANWVSRRNRFHSKSAGDTNANETSSSESSADSVKASSTTSFLSFLCPLLKLFSGGDPSQQRNDALEVATSSLSTLARLPWGSKALSGTLNSQDTTSAEPSMRLQLFEFVVQSSVFKLLLADVGIFLMLICPNILATEACPFCRRVREALTELDLSVEVYPCPKGSVRHREMVKNSGGKEQFPFLIDPNTGVSMYESGEIVKYLFQQYGRGKIPSTGLLESTVFTGWMPTILRAGRGMTLWGKAPPNPPPKKLELFSYENNPYARIVREALCELELPYILQNVGEGSPRTKLLLDTSGSKEVPYMIDPNTGAQIGNYKSILSYLFQTYSGAVV